MLQLMSDDPKMKFRPETLAVAHGYDPEFGMWAAKPPIFMTSTFVYPSAQHAKDVHEAFFEGTGPLKGTTNHIYARLGHPGLDFLEKRLAAMDGAEAAAAFSSGMAAHSAIALAFMRPGDSMLHGRPIYGGVDMLYNTVMPGFGTHAAAYLDGTDEHGVRAAAEAAMARGPLKLIIAETPANPTAAIVDLALMVRIADEAGERQGHRPLVVVDNTLLGPFAQRPVDYGVDLILTSLTKYCGGHSDLLAGGITGRKELIDRLRMLRTTWGNHLDPYTSWLVLRSLESVHVRSERAMSNARAVAEFLRDHPKVAGVTYLGFLPEGTPARAVSQLSRFMTGVEIHPGAQLGQGVFIDHGMGVVIGETAVVGDDVTIYHGVTLGGVSLDEGKRHPTVGDGVTIGAGAKVLGNIVVGDGSRIGANSVLVRSVDAGSVVVGVPGQVVSGHATPEAPMPHRTLHVSGDPDPVGRAVKGLLERVEHLERQVGEPVSEAAYRRETDSWVVEEDFSI